MPIPIAWERLPKVESMITHWNVLKEAKPEDLEKWSYKPTSKRRGHADGSHEL